MRTRIIAMSALAASAFCYVATETMPIGILSLIAGDLGVSRAAVGLLITGYAVTVAIVTIPLTYGTRNVPRRRLLVVLLFALTVANLLSALAPTYGVLLAARLGAALSQAIFWAVVAPVVAAMFDVTVRGRVGAVVFAGASLGPMLGVPAGTWLGQQYGWRSAFLALTGLALAAFVTLLAGMPDVRVAETHAATGTSPDARRYAVVVAVTTLSVAGLYTAFTYTEVFLTAVTGFAAAAVAPLLLARGIADFAGIAAGGYAGDRWQRGAVAGSVLLVAAALIAQYAAGESRSVTAVLLAVTGFGIGALTPALQNRVLEVAPGSTDMASAGNSVAFNVGIAGGSLLGAAVLSGPGARATALAGGLLALAALLLFAAEPVIVRRTPVTIRR
ncbi:MFS transporter [Actinoplanes lobatus]|uniref:DHA1 family inner membrane transport protein n=1 Tax=Actinoplanes lobatus TaxID=113568 RepID=A0A7W7HFY3_9ACTN|nr:MFS transporter [Actinoplanes lobatus]MBB4749825.1 DHA1 family inner membrane transport protein [Actinoplanes lobatus]GGN93255.1 MFS transporter [Actinoplanes lobatus]GIE38562.1 MFS transporter [Actinoplanes lobatus]